MSEIPVGSPPVPPGRHAAPGGWYPDPANSGQERYWDGWQWSRNVRPVETTGPPGMPPPPPIGQAGPSQYSQGPQQPGQQQPYGQQKPQQPYGQQQPGQQPYGQPAPQGAQAAFTADGVPLAGWWWRVLAVIVDSIIVSLLAAIPSIPIYRKLMGTMIEIFRETVRAAEAGQAAPAVPTAAELISTTDQLLLAVFSLTIGLLYVALFWRFKGATPGKMLCGLRVVPVDQGQHRAVLPWNAVLTRAVIWVLPSVQVIFMIFQLLDVLFPLWQPKRQAIHDLAAKTQVVKIR